MRLEQDGCGVSLSYVLQLPGFDLQFSLIWPVIVAGSYMYGTDRILVTEIFEAFRWVPEQYLFS
jgi:hypothetical protein